ncbi:MAG: alpha/beta hydrolase [Candidatus Margulisiibacteriota bacterium]
MKSLTLFPANGIHHDAYKPTLDSLLCDAKAINYPPLNHPSPLIPSPFAWDYFYNHFKHNLYESTIGMGHSLGATLLLYHALKHPGQWKTIIIVEPALFSPFIRRIYRFIQFFGLENHVHPMIQLTKRRRNTFESIDSIFRRWRYNPSFQNFSDESLMTFIEASVMKDASGYKLRFPKDWEIAIYRAMCSLDPFIWANLNQLTSRLIVVGGETSNTFLKGCRKRIKLYANEFITIPNTTHLLPFETPNALASIINHELKSFSSNS